MDSLYPFDHLYISRVKLSSFLYSLSIMTKRESSFVYESSHVLRGRNTFLCKGELCFILLEGMLTSFFLYTGLVTMFTYIVLIFDIYMMMYVFFTYLYMCCFFSIFMHMPWWVLFKVFQKYRLSKSTYHKLSSCKVFQEFVLR